MKVKVYIRNYVLKQGASYLYRERKLKQLFRNYPHHHLVDFLKSTEIIPISYSVEVLS